MKKTAKEKRNEEWGEKANESKSGRVGEKWHEEKCNMAWKMEGLESVNP